MSRFGIGQPVRRVEDQRFLTGRSRYVDDIELPRMLHGAVVMSPHAHARIRGIDIEPALESPGVELVLTGEDAKADGLGGIPPLFMPEDMGGPKGYRTFRPLLEPAKVRYVGDRVAFVVARTPEEARVAAERVEVDYEPLPAAVSVEDAAREGAPKVWDDNAAGNLAFPLMMGNKEATEAAFAKARHTASVRLYNNRISANAMEPRAADWRFFKRFVYALHELAEPSRRALDPRGCHLQDSRDQAARDLARRRRRLRHEGRHLSRGRPGAVGLAQAGRPVKWVATRTESLLGDNHGRDQLITAEMALDENGKILAVRAQALHAVGAYVTNAGVVPVLCSLRNIPNVYVVPAMLVASKATFTHTTPLGPYRGAGRPEASYVIERLMDEAARKLDLDPVELRRRNFIPPSAMPYNTTRAGPSAAAGWTTTPASSPAHRPLPRDFRLGRLRRAARRFGVEGKLRGRALISTSSTPAFSTSAWSCASTRAAWSPSSPARIRTARATPRPMRSSSGLARCAVREHPLGPGRHRRGSVRPRHVRLAQRHARQHGPASAPPTRSSRRAS